MDNASDGSGSRPTLPPTNYDRTPSPHVPAIVREHLEGQMDDEE